MDKQFSYSCVANFVFRLWSNMNSYVSIFKVAVFGQLNLRGEVLWYV